MGSSCLCKSKKPLSIVTPPVSPLYNTQKTQGEFYPPPNLVHKSIQSPTLKDKKDLLACVSGLELNEILEKGGNIESNLSLLILTQTVSHETINQTNIQLLKRIDNQKKLLKTFKDKDLIKMILEDYDEFIGERFGNMIHNEYLWNKAEMNFCTNILFNATEINQVILSLKKKKNKCISYWWLPPLVNFSDSYDDSDTYLFMRKKIFQLENQLKKLFTSILCLNGESQTLKKDCSFLENSETHQAKKCEQYILKKVRVVV